MVIVGRLTQRPQRRTSTQKTGREFAGFWVRVASITLDGLLVSVFSLFLLYFVVKLFHSIMTTETYLRFILFGFFPSLIFASYFYLAWFDAEGRSTAGKRLFGLAVVDTSFKPIAFSKSLLRTLAYIFDIPGIWFILVNKKKQTVHDILAKTYVIKAKAPHKLEKLFIFGLFALFVGELLYGSDVKNHYVRNYVQTFRIPTGAMKPSILVGDFILVDKYWPRNNLTKQGDIIVFKYPKDPTLDYIKRCIAVGGQTVEIKNGNVYIDGDPEGEKVQLGREYEEYDLGGGSPISLPQLSGELPTADHRAENKQKKERLVEKIKVATPGRKSYVIQHYADSYVRNDSFGPVTVPEGRYFMMGDNRDNSSDSRVWGFLPQKNVMGKAGIIYWSWDGLNKKVRWSRIGKALQ